MKMNLEALTFTKELQHSLTTSFALGFVAVVHQCRREVSGVQDGAEKVIQLCNEHGLPIWLAWGTMLRGWALVEQGLPEEVEQIRQGMKASQANGNQLLITYYLGLLAESCGKVRQIDEGLNVVTESLALVQNDGEQY